MIPIKNSAGINRMRQLKAMINKNIILKKRNMCNLVFELVFPFGCGLILFYIGYMFRCDPNNYPDTPGYCDTDVAKRTARTVNSIMIPIIMTLAIAIIFSFSGRFILTNIVADKETKMRETLRIMSLSRLSYASSYFIVQGCITFIQAVIMASLCFWNDIIFPDGGIMLIPILTCFGLANITFCMALSCLFGDSKLANQTGGILLILPVACYMYFVSTGIPGFAAAIS